MITKYEARRRRQQIGFLVTSLRVSGLLQDVEQLVISLDDVYELLLTDLTWDFVIILHILILFLLTHRHCFRPGS